jgi:hypothetical protein
VPPWNPWDALLERADVVVNVTSLPPGVNGAYQARGKRRAIVLAQSLERTERTATLAHELVHDERGGGAGYRGQPDSWAAVVARDERQVDDEVARRLVPSLELGRLWRRTRSVGDTLEPWDVAAAFDVPVAVAARALELHRGCGRTARWEPARRWGPAGRR